MGAGAQTVPGSAPLGWDFCSAGATVISCEVLKARMDALWAEVLKPNSDNTSDVHLWMFYPWLPPWP